MKFEKSGIVERLQAKHKERLAEAQREWKKKMGRPKSRRDSYESDWIMFSKWAYRVGKGWYGFSLGSVPRVWTDVLDEFLSWLESQCPDFEIHQVKIKFRKLRFYAGKKTEFVIPDEKIRSEISKLEKLLSLPSVPQTVGLTARPRRQKRLQ